jgi:hypothetical protein
LIIEQRRRKMSKFWVGAELPEGITEICWQDKDGNKEGIEQGIEGIIYLSSIYKEDVPKLIKALQKAKELGWWKEEEEK